MPVLKIKNNGVWEELGGTSPADGGNADTLDGKHSSAFASATDLADLQNKVGDSTVAEQVALATKNKSDIGHLHDDRYYTEEEVNALIDGIDWFSQGVKIPSNSDLNEYMTPGKYYVQNGTTARTLINIPNGLVENFVMYVFKRTHSNALNQMLITINSALYIRGTNESGAFYSWKRYVDSDELSDIASTLSEQMNEKIDKVDGKGLSTNDYTDSDRNKLAGIEDGANKTVVDVVLSSSSSNPVQNKVIYKAIDDLNKLIGDTSVEDQISDAISENLIYKQNDEPENAVEGSIWIDMDEDGDIEHVNADTLGGYSPSEYVMTNNVVNNFNTTTQGYVADARTVKDLNDRLNKAKAGFIYPLACATVPDGFLLCDGNAYLRTEYPELFAAIGTIYGAGDGSTTFNVPSLNTRVPVGAGNGYPLGATGGEEQHTLTVDEIPEHSHETYAVKNANINGGTGTNILFAGENWAQNNISTNTSGGEQPHNNMQPYTVVNYIIATGKNTGVSVSDIITGAQAIPLGIEYGGTGATNGTTGLKNLLHSGPIVLKEGVDYHYGDTLPSPGTKGRIFFLKVSD